MPTSKPEIKVAELQHLQNRKSEKWRAFPREILPMPFAVMDFELAEPIKTAITGLIQDSDAGYLGEIPELGENFSAFASNRWGWKVKPKEVRVAPDVGVAVIEVARLISKPGDQIIINTPVYYNFFNWIREIHCQAVDIPLIAPTTVGDSYRLDLERIEAGYRDGAQVHILCHPHNPVGSVYPVDDLLQLADLAKRHGVTILSDEIHSPLIYESERYKPFLSISDTAKDVGISFVSATKAFSFAGLKCAQMISQSDGTTAILDRLPQAIHSRASLYGAIASSVAYGECEPWLDAVIDYLDQRRSQLETLVSEKLAGVRYAKPDAGYFGWLDLRGVIRDEEIDNVSQLMIEQGKIAIASGSLYGPSGRGFIRINFATSGEILVEAIDRIGKALSHS